MPRAWEELIRRFEFWFSLFSACKQICEFEKVSYKSFTKFYEDHATVQLHTGPCRIFDGGPVYIELNAINHAVKFKSCELASAVSNQVALESCNWVLA
jgi:hypothetical protein